MSYNFSVSEFAAVTPVAIGARTEAIATYFSNNWESLVDLLTAPAAFMRSKEFLWHQNTSDRIPWILLDSSTAKIECAYRDEETALESLCQIAPALGQDFDLDSLDFDALVTKGAGNPLPDGGYLVQFSIYTRNFNLRYFPPKNPRSGARFGGQISEVSLLVFGAGRRWKGDLHFDIGTGDRERAEYLVTQLENPQWLVEELETRLHSLDGIAQIRRSMCDHHDILSNVAGQTATRETVHPSTSFRLKKGTSDSFSHYPNLMAQGFDNPCVFPFCINMFVRGLNTWSPDNGGDLFLGESVMQSYHRMAYDPGSLVRGIMSEEFATREARSAGIR